VVKVAGWAVLGLVAIAVVTAVVVDVIVMTVVTGVGHSRSNSYVTAILTFLSYAIHYKL